VAIWAELDDVRRFANARQAVRFTGLDITVSESAGKRARGHLARQGSPVLRWALHEAAMCAARPSSPDHAYYLAVKQRLGGKRAALSVARTLAREAYHTLGAWASWRWPPPRSQRLPDAGRHRGLRVLDQLMWCGLLPEIPAATLVVDGLGRTSGRTRHVREPDRPSRRRALAPEHRDKAGHPRAGMPHPAPAVHRPRSGTVMPMA